MTMYRVDISVITLWLHAKLLLYLAFNGRERKNCNDSSSESLSETDGKLMSVWMFPFVYVFMDTDNEMEDSFRCHHIQDFCEYMIFFSIIQ